MKYVVAITLHLLAFSFVAFGQAASDVLVMTGTITDIDAVTTANKGKKTTQFKIQISLQIRNRTHAAYLVLRPESFYGTRKVEFLSATGSVGDISTIETKPVCFSRRGNPCEFTYDSQAKFFSSIEDDQTPKLDWFVTIDPDGYFEFNDTFLVETGFEFDESEAVKELERQENEFWKPRLESIAKEKHKILAQNQRHSADRDFSQEIFTTTNPVKRSKFPYLRVEYRLSAKRHTKAPDIFLTLQGRWRSLGKLPIDGDDYYIRSEQIINDSRFTR